MKYFKENNDEDNSLLNMYLKASKQSINTLYSVINIPVNESLYEAFTDGIVYYEESNILSKQR